MNRVFVMGGTGFIGTEMVTAWWRIEKHQSYTHWAELLIQLARPNDPKAAVHLTCTTIYQQRGIAQRMGKSALRFPMLRVCNEAPR